MCPFGDYERSLIATVTATTFRDRTLTKSVKSALSTDEQTRWLSLEVETVNSTVYLSGIASTDEQRQRAARITRRVAGVDAVENLIAIRRAELSSELPGSPLASPFMLLMSLRSYL